MEIGPILRSMLRNRVRSVIIIGEVALTLALVVNLLLPIMESRAEMARDSGMDDPNLIHVRSVPFADEFQEETYLSDSLEADLAALRAMPGVRAVSSTRIRPWAGGGSSTVLRIPGSDLEPKRTQIYPADDQIVETLALELVEGRSFTAAEVEENADVMLVSRAYADLFWPGESPLGKSMVSSWQEEEIRVVGVLGEFYNPYAWGIGEYVAFYPGYSGSFGGGSNYIIRTEAGAMDAVYASIEPRLLGDNDGRNLQLRSTDEYKEQFFVAERILLGVLTVSIALVVLVTALGIVGLTAFSVAQRTRQIGTRRALGATRAAIVRYFVLESLLAVGLGVVVGTVLAVAVNIGLAQVMDIARLDPAVLAAGAALLLGAGLLAALPPALRAARVQPVIATRNV